MKVVFGIPELLSLAAMLGGIVYYLLILYRLLARTAAHNRSMNPALVWLNLIPVFNLGWMIWTVLKLSESLSKELAERQIANVDLAGRNMGLFMMACAITCIATVVIPPLSLLLALATIICWSIHWGKMASYLKQLG